MNTVHVSTYVNTSAIELASLTDPTCVSIINKALFYGATIAYCLTGFYDILMIIKNIERS